MTRTSGIGVPLFSVPTRRSWGLGEFPDLVDLARWADGAGQSIVQILPVMELPEHERSPYSALSSFALDPTYIARPDVPFLAWAEAFADRLAPDVAAIGLSRLLALDGGDPVTTAALAPALALASRLGALRAVRAPPRTSRRSAR